MPLLSDELFAALEQELAKGPVAHGWPDQTWTLSRIKTLIGRRFHESYTVQSVARELKRLGQAGRDEIQRIQRTSLGTPGLMVGFLRVPTVGILSCAQ